MAGRPRRDRRVPPEPQEVHGQRPTRPDRSEYDGVIGTPRVPIACRALLDNVAELYFESEDAKKAAFGSETGQELTEDFETFVDAEASPTLYVEEDVRLVKTD